MRPVFDQEKGFSFGLDDIQKAHAYLATNNSIGKVVLRVRSAEEEVEEEEGGPRMDGRRRSF